jgi:hypothetical protein
MPNKNNQYSKSKKKIKMPSREKLKIPMKKKY